MARLSPVTRGALVAAGLLGLAACAEPFSNDDVVFLKSLPNTALVRMGLPGPAAQGLAARAVLGDEAEGARTAREVADGIDGAISGAYRLLDAITAYPPSARDATSRVWGPFPVGEGDAILFVTRTSTPAVRVPTSTTTLVPLREVFEFALQGTRAGDVDPRTLLVGSFAESGGARRGIGALWFDFDAVRALDPGGAQRGQLYIGYDTRAAVELVLGGVNQVVPDGVPDAFARLTRTATGAIDFRFVYRADLEAGPDGQPTSALETLASVNRFEPDRRGRTDLVIAGGDLPLTVYASECWDTQLRRTYYETGPTPWGGPRQGDVLTCPERLRRFAE